MESDILSVACSKSASAAEKAIRGRAAASPTGSPSSCLVAGPPRAYVGLLNRDRNFAFRLTGTDCRRHWGLLSVVLKGASSDRRVHPLRMVVPDLVDLGVCGAEDVDLGEDCAVVRAEALLIENLPELLL